MGTLALNVQVFFTFQIMFIGFAQNCIMIYIRENLIIKYWPQIPKIRGLYTTVRSRYYNIKILVYYHSKVNERFAPAVSSPSKKPVHGTTEVSAPEII